MKNRICIAVIAFVATSTQVGMLLGAAYSSVGTTLLA